jgi:hypothetical protein
MLHSDGGGRDRSLIDISVAFPSVQFAQYVLNYDVHVDAPDGTTAEGVADAAVFLFRDLTVTVPENAPAAAAAGKAVAGKDKGGDGKTSVKRPTLVVSFKADGERDEHFLRLTDLTVGLNTKLWLDTMELNATFKCESREAIQVTTNTYVFTNIKRVGDLYVRKFTATQQMLKASLSLQEKYLHSELVANSMPWIKEWQAESMQDDKRTKTCGV